MSKSVLRVKMVGSKNCTSLVYRYSFDPAFKEQPYPIPTPFIQYKGIYLALLTRYRQMKANTMVPIIL